jgi:hypothetical protein
VSHSEGHIEIVAYPPDGVPATILTPAAVSVTNGRWLLNEAWRKSRLNAPTEITPGNAAG